MPRVLLDSAPDDAYQTLCDLKGDGLLSFFKTLPWDSFLASFLSDLPLDQSMSLLTELKAAVPDVISDKIVIPVGDIVIAELVEEFRSVYLLSCAEQAGALDIIGDVERAWSAREDDAAGRLAVGAAIDVMFPKDNAHKASIPIAKAIDSLGILCEEVKTNAGRPSRFYTSSTRGSQAVKKLTAYWENSVPQTTAAGFIGRHYDDSLENRKLFFKFFWSDKNASDLDSHDAKELASFLSPDGTPTSSSAASCRRFLERIIHDSDPGPVSGTPGVLRPDGLSRDVPPINVASVADAQGESPLDPVSKHDKVRNPSKNRKTAMTAGNKPALAAADDGSETSDDFSSEDSPDEDFLETGRGRKHPKFPGLPGAHFPGPRKMIQVLEQGGPPFEELFEPLRVDITTSKVSITLINLYKFYSIIIKEGYLNHSILDFYCPEIQIGETYYVSLYRLLDELKASKHGSYFRVPSEY